LAQACSARIQPILCKPLVTASLAMLPPYMPSAALQQAALHAGIPGSYPPTPWSPASTPASGRQLGTTPKDQLAKRLREMQLGWQATERFFQEQQVCSPMSFVPDLSPMSCVPQHFNWQAGALAASPSASTASPAMSSWGSATPQPASASRPYCPGEMLAKSAELVAAEPDVRSDCSTADTLEGSLPSVAPTLAYTPGHALEGAEAVPDAWQLCTTLEPKLGSDELPTEGSRGHSLGQCKPCAFVATRGCHSGVNCKFCHLCGPDEKRRRLREKKELLHAMRQSRNMTARQTPAHAGWA